MRLIAFIAALMAMAGPRETVSDFLALAASSRVSFEYTYSTGSGKAVMTGSGSVIVQGSVFLMKGDGLEVVCDGRSRWTVDRAAGEAIVENVSEGEDFAANPALFLSQGGKGFTVKETRAVKKDGKDLVVAVLEPEARSNVRQVIMYITPELSLAEAEVTVADGTVTRFTVGGFSAGPASDDISVFVLDKGSLGPDTVITDLR